MWLRLRGTRQAPKPALDRSGERGLHIHLHLEYDTRGALVATDSVRAAAFLGGQENGTLFLRADDRAVHLPDLVLELAVRDQGMGARSGAATRAHAAGCEGR